MIALSGCARKNADRELARLLALVDRHVRSAKSQCAIEALRALADDATALKHRALEAQPPARAGADVGLTGAF